MIIVERNTKWYVEFDGCAVPISTSTKSKALTEIRRLKKARPGMPVRLRREVCSVGVQNY